MGFNKGQIFFVILVIILIIGIAALGTAVINNKPTPKTTDGTPVVGATPQPMYGYDVPPGDSSNTTTTT